MIIEIPAVKAKSCKLYIAEGKRKDYVLEREYNQGKRLNFFSTLLGAKNFIMAITGINILNLIH